MSLESCGNCGNCIDQTELSDITIEAQKIFSCILRMREQYGITLIAEVLKGCATKKLLQMHFDNLPTYGIMKELSLTELKDLINLLIADDYLYATQGKYPVVKLKPKASLILKHEAKVLQRMVLRQTKLSNDGTLFEALRRLRRKIADTEGVPPYIIFADSTLQEMSQYTPTDSKGLLAIKGVGERKMEKYGFLFLNCIKEHLYDSKQPTPLKDL